MESSSWPESSQINRIKAIQELTQGQVFTNQLHVMHGQSKMVESSLELVDRTLVQIMGMFERTRSVLSSSPTSNFNKIPCNQTRDHMTFPNNWDDQMTSEGSVESVETMIPVKTRRGCYKRRKNSSEFTKVISELVDDGYAWRKYGQKVILNTKHQRHYYRCSHKFEQGCLATKQVQMTDDEPPKYRITYHQGHTCNDLQISCLVDSPNPRDNLFLLSFETNTLIQRKQVGHFPSSTTKR